MADKVNAINCPSCGAPVSRSDKICEFCNREIIVTSFSTISSLLPAELQKYSTAYKALAEKEPLDASLKMSFGFCSLKLKVYDLAISSFETAIEQHVDNPEVYFYAAVAQLRGKKAFLASRQVIDKSESYINAAIELEERPIFYYFLAYIKYDYYERKSYRSSPSYDELLNKSLETGLNESEVSDLHELLCVQRPQQLTVQKHDPEPAPRTSEPPHEASRQHPQDQELSPKGKSAPKTSKSAVWSLIFGVVSIFGGMFLILPPIIAIILGYRGLAEQRKNSSLSGGRLAVWGLILGWLCLGLVAWAVLLGAMTPSK
jgi:hypothetical protein